MPLNCRASPSVRVSPMCSWPWLWMPMMSPATASSMRVRSLAMKTTALAIFMSLPVRRRRPGGQRAQHFAHAEVVDPGAEKHRRLPALEKRIKIEAVAGAAHQLDFRQQGVGFERETFL